MAVVALVVGGIVVVSPLAAGASAAGTTGLHASAPSTAPILPVAVACPSTSDCTAVGSTGSGANGGNYTGVIAVTTDAGRSWTYRAVPPEVENLTGVACASTSDCTAVGYNYTTGGATASAVIVATTDGGVTWTSQTVPSGVQILSAIACPAATSDCIAVGYTVDSLGSANGATIVATTNGGATWANRQSPRVWAPSAVLPARLPRSALRSAGRATRMEARQAVPLSPPPTGEPPGGGRRSPPVWPTSAVLRAHRHRVVPRSAPVRPAAASLSPPPTVGPPGRARRFLRAWALWSVWPVHPWRSSPLSAYWASRAPRRLP